MATLGSGGVTRREFTIALAAAIVVRPTVFTAPLATPIPARTLNHIAFRVSDVERTVEWYQRIFGMPVQYRQDPSGPAVAEPRRFRGSGTATDLPGGNAAILRIGDGTQCVALYPANGSTPGHSHMGFGVPNFDRDKLARALEAHGVRTELRDRGDVEELFFRDSDDLLVQLQDTSYCGGSGVLGNMCHPPWQMPRTGNPPPLPVRTLNHVSFQVSDLDRAVRFYMRVFDMWIQTVQPMTEMAPVPLLGIGEGPELIAPYGGGGAEPGIGHSCVGLEGFDYDRVARMLNDLGEELRGRIRPAKPPYDVWEGYMLRDPDGIPVQIADMTYCGGRGHLGQLCP